MQDETEMSRAGEHGTATDPATASRGGANNRASAPPQPDAAGFVIRKGEPDPLGDTVDRIHIVTEPFVIYSIACSDAESRRPRYCLHGDYQTSAAYRQRLNGIGRALDRINDLIVGMRPDVLTLPFYRNRYRALVEIAREHQARAMQQAFEGDGDGAAQALTTFGDEVENVHHSRNKMRYILANAFALLVLVCLWYALRKTAGATAIIESLMTAPTKLDPAGEAASVRLVDMLALGAVGAFFSVSIGINNLKVDNAITIPEMFYAGFVRILIGVIGAGVVFLLIFGGWILTAVSPPFQLWSYALFAFLAGFSELFVPNALKQAEATVVVKARAATQPPAAADGERRPPPREPG